MSTPVTAHLSDGRSIDVPARDVESWQYEVENGDTTTGLADWYTDGGEEHVDQINGRAIDSTRCEHQMEHGNNTPTVLVNSPSGNRSSRVCGRRACILDAFAWVERADDGREAGMGAVWRDVAGVFHSNPPEDDVDLTVRPEKVAPPVRLVEPLDQAAAAALMREDGFVTVQVTMDQDAFMEAVGDRYNEDAIEDAIHDLAFTFGITHDSTRTIVAVESSDLVLEYTTNIAEMLGTEDEVVISEER